MPTMAGRQVALAGHGKTGRRYHQFDSDFQEAKVNPTSVQVSYKPEGCDTSASESVTSRHRPAAELAGEQRASLGGSVARVCPPRAAASKASRECLELAGRSR